MVIINVTTMKGQDMKGGNEKMNKNSENHKTDFSRRMLEYVVSPRFGLVSVLVLCGVLGTRGVMNDIKEGAQRRLEHYQEATQVYEMPNGDKIYTFDHNGDGNIDRVDRDRVMFRGPSFCVIGNPERYTPADREFYGLQRDIEKEGVKRLK